MVNHITPDELEKLDMLMLLQRMAGIETTFAFALEGWRAMSEPAQAHVIAAYNSMVFIKGGYKPMGESHDVPSSNAQARKR